MAIQFFTTGGSIDKVYSTLVSQFVVGDPAVESILKEANVTLDYSIEPLIRKDSLEITPSDRQVIVDAVRSCPQRQVIITHGTDTMVETARALLSIPGKVIVLTGAMQPAGFKITDAAFNLGSAVLAVQALPEGVFIVFNGRIFDPVKTNKNVALDRYQEASEAI